MTRYFFTIVFIFFSSMSFAQISTNKNSDTLTYTNLEEALKKPELVKRLDLSNQEITLTDDVLKRFKNLEYLSLRNDHLKEVPHGLVYLNKLRVLDISGNDFERLPRFVKKISSLEEVYLDSETGLDINQSISVLTKLPNLKSLHLENDGLTTLPRNLNRLKSLESLYLNNNNIDQFPIKIKLPKKLKLIDLQMNKIGEIIDKENRFGRGLIIRF